MGCSSSKSTKPSTADNNMSVQDEARSFRSKVDAIRFILRNVLSRHAFKLYLEKHSGVEYLLCYIDLEEIKSLGNDTMIALTTYMLSKYKSMNDEAENDPKAVISQIIWEKLRRLRDLDLQQTPSQKLVSVIINVQNQILTELTDQFQGFLKSPDYKEWKEHQMKLEKEKSKLPTNHNNKLVQATTAGIINKTDGSEISRSFVLQKKMLQQEQQVTPKRQSFLNTKTQVSVRSAIVEDNENSQSLDELQLHSIAPN